MFLATTKQYNSVAQNHSYNHHMIKYIMSIITPVSTHSSFLDSKTQMTADDVLLTKKIAQLRAHIERAIGRIKEYHILRSTLPAVMWDSISEVIYVCCMMTNFSPPLVS